MLILVMLFGGGILLDTGEEARAAARTSARTGVDSKAASEAALAAAESAKRAAEKAEEAGRAATDLLNLVNGILDPNGPVAQAADAQRQEILRRVDQAVERLAHLVRDNQALSASNAEQQRAIDELARQLTAARSQIAALPGGAATPAPTLPAQTCRAIGNSGRELCR